MGLKGVHRKLNVLMVTGVYHPEVSGAAAQCRLLVQALKYREGFLVLTTTRDIALHRQSKVDDVDVNRIRVRKESRIDYFNAFFMFISFFLCHRKDFQIIHLHGFSSKSILLVLLSKIFHKKIIIKMTSIGHDDPVAMKNRGFFLYHFYEKADVYVGVSPQFESIYRNLQLPADRFRLISNGVDTKRFQPADEVQKGAARKELGLPLELKLILFVGHFSMEKRPDVLFEAWRSYVANAYPDSGIVFIGSTNPDHYEVDTSLVKKVQREAEPYLTKRVIFVEKTHEIEKYYQAVDMFVLPSIREGLPNALIEAMACGLPVIASRLAGVTEWVIEDSVYGVLFEPNSREELGNAMLCVLNDADYARLLGVKARKRIIEDFSMAKIAANYQKLYMELSI